MAFFNQIDGSVVLRNRGRFNEAKLYECDGEIFAKYGSGFIRLKRDGFTSLEKVLWTAIDSTAARSFDLTTGNMVLGPSNLSRVA
jgi:hypothetical protein